MNARKSRPSKPTVPRRSGEELVAAIVAAATEVFAAGGKNATVRAIAARADVQPSVIYRYFPSKRALLGEVVAQGSRRDVELISDLLGGPPPQLVAATLENTAYRTALLHGVLAGLQLTDIPGGLPSIELTARGLMSGKYTPARPDERFDPRLVTAFLAAALVGWQATGSFFAAAAGLGRVDAEDVQAAVAYLLDQVYGLAEPGRRMEDD